MAEPLLNLPRWYSRFMMKCRERPAELMQFKLLAHRSGGARLALTDANSGALAAVEASSLRELFQDSEQVTIRT
jgi:hypothetical protein